MLDDVSQNPADEIIIRFANPRDDVSALIELGLSPDECDEFLTFLGRPGQGTQKLQQFIDSVFEFKPRLERRSHRTSRFSDQDTRAYYASLELETTEKECLHWYIRCVIPADGSPVYYRRIECRFRGTAKDLRPKLEEWPWLVGEEENYPKCLTLAREAVASEIDGFLAPSARRSGGTTTPVFSRQALSEPEDRARAGEVDVHCGLVRVVARDQERRCLGALGSRIEEDDDVLAGAGDQKGGATAALQSELARVCTGQRHRLDLEVTATEVRHRDRLLHASPEVQIDLTQVQRRHAHSDVGEGLGTCRAVVVAAHGQCGDQQPGGDATYKACVDHDLTSLDDLLCH